MTVRRLAPMALCGALVLGGCGGGGDEPEVAAPPSNAAPSTPAAGQTPSPSATPTTNASPSPSTAASGSASPSGPTSADAKKLAAAGVLTAADLAGWTRQAQTQEPEDDAIEQATKECLGLANTPYLHRNLGFTYNKDGVDVSSDADVTATTAQAESEFAALGGAKSADCYRKALADVFPPDATISVETIEPTVAGADDTVGFRLSAEFAGPAGQVFISGYEIAALAGRTMIWLNSAESAKTAAYKLGALTALAAKLVARVDAAS